MKVKTRVDKLTKMCYNKGTKKVKEERNMKPRKAFYMNNLETIKELEDKVFDLTMKMERECGKQDFNEKLNQAWSLLYEVWQENK